MTRRERFIAVCRGEKPDYVPIIGFPWAPGMAGGCQRSAYYNLLATGMPDIGGCWDPAAMDKFNLKGWQDYWGTEGPLSIDFYPAKKYSPGITGTKTIKDGFEYIEFNTGALTKQVVDNDITYSMPEHIIYDVRDRDSFEYYKYLCTPSDPWTDEELDEACKKYDNRTQPLWITCGATWGQMRNLMGPYLASTILYDDPELVMDYMDWIRHQNRTFLFPLIKRLKPEVVAVSEDFCYNHGMFISGEHFNKFCAKTYAEIGDVVKANDIPMFLLDCDGFVEPALPLLIPHGLNAVFPWEVKSGNDLYRVRERYPELIMLGGIEKECVNAGNEGTIKSLVLEKRDLIKKGRYFPNGDHGIQPDVTFEGMRRFMTWLHEITENPEGTFPRLYD
ncbi:MAG: hypothetical protein FWC73_04545 [Defluviitaleaceae bacterium]|nr:hypothetical protein [Defluviitaleaceae bacterium]